MLLRYNKKSVRTHLSLPGSKSISNRLLVLNEVLNLDLKLRNISTSKDTQTLQTLLKNPSSTLDVGHAGTDMRFLTALLATKQGEWTLTGSERMKERPIRELVNALRSIGADISYLEKEGFPPLKIKGKELNGGKIEIDGSVSSQFVSALALIAPSLSGGLQIELKNNIVSRSYIQMTLDLLKEFGVGVSFVNQTIVVNGTGPDPVENSEYHVESDWSCASYWFSIAALTNASEILLSGLHPQSLQGDSVLCEIYKSFGVSSEFREDILILTSALNKVSSFEYDFTDCPDIVQTIAVTCLGLKIPCRLTGLSTLKNKETDRLVALKNELEKFGAQVKITSDSLELVPAGLSSKPVKVKTYSDHRMAMSFAPLAFLTEVEIENAEVVEKSYPEFWQHLSAAGIECIPS
jgi:3-phosphoshikimate 1-carboxyvinyltransferase